MPEGQRPDPPAHCARFAVNGTLESARWTNVFWVRNGRGTTPSAGDFQAFCDDVLAGYKNTLTHLQGIRSITQECTGLYYGPTGGILAAVSTGGQAGNQGGDVLPASVALCIGWRVQQHYRGGHPRTYVAGQTTDHLQDSTTWTSGHTDSARDNANAFLTWINGRSHGDFSDPHLGTVSFVLRKAWRDPPVFRDYIPGAAFVDSRVDTMRSRLGPDR